MVDLSIAMLVYQGVMVENDGSTTCQIGFTKRALNPYGFSIFCGRAHPQMAPKKCLGSSDLEGNIYQEVFACLMVKHV
jgi:hypothetical protein